MNNPDLATILDQVLGLEGQSSKGANQPTKGPTTSATTGTIGEVKPKKKNKPNPS